jgi:hypothetical protein
MSLPALLDLSEIETRLAAIFSEGTPHRPYCIREMAAKTVFVMLYVGAVEGTGIFMGPKQAYRMTDKQAAKTGEDVRLKYAKDSRKANFAVAGKRWYADNSREPLRDETLRDGLVANGAVIVDASVPTTSGKGRYALQREFAELFSPKLKGNALVTAIEQWQEAHLSHSALVRTRLLRVGAAAALEKVRVQFPNGVGRLMEPGPSSVIMKAVIEVFAPKFLREPAVVWVSESGNKVVIQDNALARDLGLKIEKDKALPDAIMADLSEKKPVLVFVEVVATDGPISEARREILLKLATDAGFNSGDVYFVTAFADRSTPAFRKSIANLAWGSFAWCLSEPDHIIVLHGGTTAYLTSFHEHLQRPKPV